MSKPPKNQPPKNRPMHDEPQIRETIVVTGRRTRGGGSLDVFSGFSPLREPAFQSRDQAEKNSGKNGGEGSDDPLTPLSPEDEAARHGIGVKKGPRGADISNLVEKMIATFPAIAAAWKKLAPGIKPVITSGRDSEEHKEGSRHYSGEAIDLRANNISIDTAKTIRNSLQKTLGNDYDVLYESPGRINAHIHIEYHPD